MKLSKKEADILACIHLRADHPIESIRKETGYRDHTIRYHIHRLEEREVIKRIPFINMCSLGFNLYNVFFSIGSENKKLKLELCKALISAKKVTWLAELGGDYQYGLEVCAKQVFEVQELLLNLSERYKNIFFEKSVTTQFSAWVLPKNYLTNKPLNVEPLSFHQTLEPVEIDELDRRILMNLTTSKANSLRSLAQLMQMPLSSLDLRIKKLEKKKVILGYMYAVDPSKFGVHSYKLLLFSKGVNPGLSKTLLKFATRHRAMTHFIECFGSWDYEIGVEVQEPQQVVDVTQELYEFAGAELYTIKVLSRFKDLKLQTFPG